MLLTDINREWLRSFAERRARAVRVLHIGNIANNAYNNAKLLNEAGFDCDVLCYDYYHSMGSPEWEDAYFDKALKDDFRPDWGNYDLGRFNRPKWFAQGPLTIAISYLLARRTGHQRLARRKWKQLAQLNLTAPLRPWSLPIQSSLRRLKFMAYRLASLTARRVRGLLNKAPWPAFKGMMRFFGFFVGLPTGAVLATITLPFFCLLQLFVLHLATLRRFISSKPSLASATDYTITFRRRCIELVEAWPLEFPERQDALRLSDLMVYEQVAPLWAELLSHYDFVIGYSTDPIHPLLAGIPYFAFEHGTIRDIPYHATTQGRCAALAYRRAQHVFVTNFDCRHSARKLAPGRYTLINHPYDEDHGLRVEGFQEARAALLRELQTEFLCFFPTRHDWVAGTGYADKANDVFFLAIAELKQAGIRIGVICCRWGSNVEQSQTLLAELGIADQVKWEAPMAMMKFERTARASDVVVDQFKLGSFGGIVFKAMAVGAPVLTYLDESQLVEQYPEVPPVINCATTQDVVEKLSRLYADRDALAQLRAASMQWIRKHHGKRETVNRQVDQFRALYAAEATTMKETG